MSFLQVTRALSAALRRDGLRATAKIIADRAVIRWFEWRHGIATDVIVGLDELGVDTKERGLYVASDYRAVRAVLRALRLQSDDVFLDIGSGMGRVVIIAATFPIRKVIGVEIADQLNSIARRNVVHARGLRCRDIELITADAAKFNIPPDVTVVFFYYPFRADVLKPVLANLRQSLLDAPRDLRLVSIAPPKSTFAYELACQTWLTLNWQKELSADCRCVIFSTSSDPAGSLRPSGSRRHQRR
jgi:SAM-dependent methyltransferase